MTCAARLPQRAGPGDHRDRAPVRADSSAARSSPRRRSTGPGIGTKLVHYINTRDYGAVQGIVTFFALVVVLVSLLVDIVNALIDPRVRY